MPTKQSSIPLASGTMKDENNSAIESRGAPTGGGLGFAALHEVPRYAAESGLCYQLKVFFAVFS
jgi:hypothetical protein